MKDTHPEAPLWNILCEESKDAALRRALPPKPDNTGLLLECRAKQARIMTLLLMFGNDTVEPS